MFWLEIRKLCSNHHSNGVMILHPILSVIFSADQRKLTSALELFKLAWLLRFGKYLGRTFDGNIED